MSRKIEEKTAVRISEAETAMRKTDEGKLIFTQYGGRQGVFLFKKDKLTVASFPDGSRVGAIYLAKVKSVVPNINACFVEIQPGDICFLPLKDAGFPFLVNRVFDGRILEGDPLLVQIVRDAQKTKQPSVTAQITLADEYFALTLLAPQAYTKRSADPEAFAPPKVGFSKKLDAGQKNLLLKMLKEGGILRSDGILNVENCLEQSAFKALPPELGKLFPFLGLTVRTRAAEFVDVPAEQIAVHFRLFLQEYLALFQTALHRTCFSCLKRSDTVENIMTELLSRQIFPDEFSEFVTDDCMLHSRLEEYVKIHLPAKSVRLYEDALLPLAKLYGLEERMEEALKERVWLKTGGYLVIQPTEALTVIDVNSGKFEGGKTAMALKLNLEASAEIARQMRLRNLSGIIIVDFVNMEEEESRAEVVNCLRRHVSRDKVRTVVVDMTPLGLVEITRKRITRPLREALGLHKGVK